MSELDDLLQQLNPEEGSSELDSLLDQANLQVHAEEPEESTLDKLIAQVPDIKMPEFGVKETPMNPEESVAFEANLNTALDAQGKQGMTHEPVQQFDYANNRPPKFAPPKEPEADIPAALGRAAEAIPSMTQQEFGGMLQGAMESPEQFSNALQARVDVLNNPEANLLDKTLALGYAHDPKNLFPALVEKSKKYGLDFISGIPSIEDAEIAFKEFLLPDRGDKGFLRTSKATNLRESIKEAGQDIAEEGRVRLEDLAGQNKTFGEQVAFTAATSTGKFFMKAGGLALFKRLNAGTITGAAGLEEWGRAYDEGMAKLGDPIAASNHAWLSAGFETGTEFLPASILLDKKNPVRDRILRFMAFDVGGENVAELGQRFSEYVNGLEGKHTIGEIWDKMVQEAPEIMALTTASTIVGSGTIVSTFEGIRQVDKAIKVYEYKKFLGEALGDAEASIRIELDKLQEQIVKEAKTQEEADAMLQAFADQNIEELKGRVPASIRHMLYDQTFGSLHGTDESSSDAILNLPGFAEPDVPIKVRFEEGQKVRFEEGQKVIFGADNKYDQYIEEELRKLEGIEALKLTFEKQRDALQQEEQTPEVREKLSELDGYIANTRSQILEQEIVINNDRVRKVVNSILADKITPLLAELNEKYTPDNAILLTDYSNDNVRRNVLIRNYLGSTGFLNERSSLGTPAAFININGGLVGRTLSVYIDAKTGQIKDSAASRKAYRDLELSLIDTAVHEYGHIVFKEMLQTLPEHVKKAMWKAYVKMMSDLGDINTEKGTKERMRGAAVAVEESKNKRFDAMQFKEYGVMPNSQNWYFRSQAASEGGSGYSNGLDYVTSFTEFLAHQFERYFTGDEGIKELKPHFRRMAAVLDRYRKLNYDKLNTSKETKAFLKKIAADAKLNSLQARERKLQEALGEVSKKETVGEIMDTTFKVLASDLKAENHSLGGDGLNNNNGIVITDPASRDPHNELDKFNLFMKWGYTLEQISWDNPHIQELKNYVSATQAWWAGKSEWNVRANDTLTDWYDLGKDQSTRLSKFLLEVTLKSDELGRKLTNDELEVINAKREHQLSDDALMVYDLIQRDFADALGYYPENPQGLYKMLLTDAKREHANNLVALEQALREIDADMRKISDRNFFPLSRFGKWTVTVKAKQDVALEGKTFKEGDVISFNTFESQKSRDEFDKKTRAELGNRVTVIPSILTDLEQSFMNIPQPFIKAIRSKLDLTAEQNDSLNNLILAMSPAQRYKKHMLERKGTAGFSLDAQRGFASYFMHFSNALSKMEHLPAMEQAIRDMDDSIAFAASQGLNHDRRRMLSDYMKNHLDYIMNPKNELASLRAFGFLWHLGAVPKSAVVNMTQLPLVAFPYLATRKELGGGVVKGDVKATLQLTNAMKDVSLMFTKRGALKDPLENKMMEELVRRGIVDESLATELAGIAEGSVLSRMMPGGTFKSRGWVTTLRRVNEVGTFMFHHAEKFNRRVVAVAAYRMARNNKMSHSEAIEEAALAVDKTQYEYARWNRPKFMRGKRSVIFLFMQYVQNTLHFLVKDPAKYRALIILALAGGLESLPFADTGMEMMNALTNLYRKYYGKAGERYDARKELRDLAVQMQFNPDMVMHGLGSKYGLGPLHVLQLAGVQVPNVDISGSIGLGNPIPGVKEGLQSMQGQRPGDAVGKAAETAAGAVVSIPMEMYRAMASDDPDEWKKWERALPNVVKGVSKATRLAVRGKETRSNGSTLMEYDWRNPQDFASLVATAGGFQDPNLKHQRELEWREREVIKFYETRRQYLLEQNNKARLTKDREGESDARKAIARYNSSIPEGLRRLKIHGGDRAESYRRFKKGVRKDESGKVRNRRYKGAVEDVRQGFNIKDERMR